MPALTSPCLRLSQCLTLMLLILSRCSYLPQRYPSLFRSTSTGIHNLLTNETFDITTRPLPEDPMATAGRLIQDDLAIMFEKADGQYYLLAGCILLAGFWRLSDKFGMPLSEIHTSGDVPGFKSKLEKGMMNFFRRIQPGQPVLRNNYFIQVDDNLAWSHSIGPEDPVSSTGRWNGQTSGRLVLGRKEQSDRTSLFPLGETEFEEITEEWGRGLHDQDLFRADYKGGGGARGAWASSQCGSELG